jgi:hypothetical protein
MLERPLEGSKFQVFGEEWLFHHPVLKIKSKKQKNQDSDIPLLQTMTIIAPNPPVQDPFPMYSSRGLIRLFLRIGAVDSAMKGTARWVGLYDVPSMRAEIIYH